MIAMVYIDNEGITDPHINLAIEEHCIRHLPVGEDYLLFYINAPSTIICRNQNTLEEIHLAYIDEQGIHDALVGVRYDKRDIEGALEDVDLYPYFGNVDRAEFIDLIYGPDEQ